MKKYILLIATIVISSLSLQAYTITSFDPANVFVDTTASGVASLDAAVGVTGYLIEDFEDTNLVSGAIDPTLIPGLTISFTGPNDHGNSANTLWDGSEHIDLNVGIGEITFNYTPGAQSLGLGIGDVESDVDIIVNGENLGFIRSLPNYSRLADSTREVYIRIDLEAGDDLITELRFVSIPQTGDALTFDHLAILNGTPVPEPSSILLLSICGAFLGCFRKKLG